MSTRFIDKYEIISTLGRGSMGVVYKGKDPEIGRLVAIKTLKAVFLGDDPAGSEALQRFRQESRSAGKLHHPNIVTIFEAGRTESGSPYIVMEYIEGQSLEMILADRGPLEPLAALHYLAQIANAVDYAHSQNVIHRDIKPSNIIVDSRQRPHLLDFGVAKLSDTSLTPTGTVVGTPSYMSPEQIRGAALDARTDLFSLAVVAFEVFTGVRPFPGGDFTTVVTNIIHKEPLSFREAKSELPPSLEAVLRKALAKERSERFSTALEAVNAMAAAFGVTVDDNGLVGGYRPGMSVDEAMGAAQKLPKATVRSVLAPETGGGRRPNGSDSSVSRNGQEARPNVSTDGTVAMKEAPVLAPVEKLPAAGARRTTPMVAALALVLVPSVLFLFNENTPSAEPAPMDRREAPPASVADEAADTTINRTAVAGLTTDSAVDRTAAESVEVAVRPANSGEVQNAAPEAILSGTASQPSAEGAAPVQIDLQTLPQVTDRELLKLLRIPGLERASLRPLIEEAAKRDSMLFVPDFITLIEHPDYLIRVDVLKGFSKSSFRGEGEVLNTIIAALDDEEYLVRGFAAKVLRDIGTPLAKAALAERLKVETHSVVQRVLREALK